MLIKINGKEEEIQAMPLGDLLKSKRIAPQMVSIELNGQMIDRALLNDTVLHEGDEMEFLYFMGGGSNNCE